MEVLETDLSEKEFREKISTLTKEHIHFFGGSVLQCLLGSAGHVSAPT